MRGYFFGENMRIKKEKCDLPIDVIEGFNLGWDFGYYGAKDDLFASASGRLKAVLDGYNHFKTKKTKTLHFEKEDYNFVMRWLRLRLNALNRGRVVNEDVTWQYLKTISSDHCPITKAQFTRGVRSATNKTLDRINNNGGYAVGNILFISRIANEAKGSRNYKQCLAMMQKATIAKSGMIEGLTSFEWARITSLTAINANDTDKGPALVPIYFCAKQQNYTTNPWKNIQIYSYYAFFANYIKGGIQNKQYWIQSFSELKCHRIMKKAKRFANFASQILQRLVIDNKTIGMEIYFLAWSNPTLIEYWLSLCNQLNEMQANLVLKKMRQYYKIDDTKTYINEHWSLDTNGFFAEANRISNVSLPNLAKEI